MQLSESHHELELAVQRTVMYAQAFQADLPESSLNAWLLSPFSFSSTAIVRCSELLFEGLLSNNTRQTWKQQSKLPHWKEAVQVVRALAWIPWIQSIWVTGSVAARNAQLSDDLDIMIITDNRRLWLTRLIGVTWSKWIGRYRGRDETKTVALRWCMNLWLEQQSISSLQRSPSLYLAREVVQAVPIYERQSGLALNFLYQNRWVEQFSANGWQMAVRQARHTWSTTDCAYLNVFIGFALFSPIWNVLNSAAWRLQQWYMQPHKSRESVHSTYAFFHPRDTQAVLQKKYEKILRDYENEQQQSARIFTRSSNE